MPGKKNENKVNYFDLPIDVRVKIAGIIRRREKTRPAVALTIGAVAAEAVLLGFTIAKGPRPGTGPAAGMLLIPAGIGATMLKGQSREFKNEAIRLHKTLSKHADNPKIKKLLEKYPYVVINLRGDLVGKKTAPSLMRIPIGRRRIASPKAGKEAIARWKKMKLPKTRNARITVH